MDWIEKIARVQTVLQKQKMDGWLIYDFQKRNLHAMQFLEIPNCVFLSRRLLYWIPSKGDPVKIVHATEEYVLDHLPGRKISYFRSSALEQEVQKLLRGVGCVAMEYSPQNAIPAISFVDAGTMDWIRSIVPKIVSSGNFIQEFTCTLNPKQRESHLQAAQVLEDAVSDAWDFLSKALQNQRKITEYDLQQKIALYIQSHECIFEGGPICAVNANSSNPHYVPTKEKHQEIRKGDFVLIDLWCKKKNLGSIYADICRVAVADIKPSQEQQDIFMIVRKAQKEATDFVVQKITTGQKLLGYEVDQTARDVIEKAGFGQYFVHRTGHNIYEQDHGPGTHLDSIETFDDREILLETCFSIEPGIYLPGKFGVRLEYDVFLTKDRTIEISGGVQEEIVSLL
jgi:Xaa-Pro aminopeptidase